MVFFLGAKYVQKEWCGLEWRAGLDLLKQKNDSRLMFLRLDDSDIPGLYSIDGYIDIRKMSNIDVSRRILGRLSSLTSGDGNEIDQIVRRLRVQVARGITDRCGTIRILMMEQPISIGEVYTDVTVLAERTANKQKTL